MGTVSERIELPGRVSEAEALWYDVRRWPTWIEGFGGLDRVSEQWPNVGARLFWTAVPGGRGRVREEVVAYEARSGQTVEIEDEQLRGRQAIAFTPVGDGMRIELSLTFELKQRPPLLGGVIQEWLTRRRLRDALRRTLRRFGRELADERRRALEGV